MKIKSIKSLRPFIIPGLIIIACIFWIVRVELKAAALASRLEEHHLSLQKNEDVLENLNKFVRSVADNEIQINSNDVQLVAGDNVISMDATGGKITNLKSSTWITWDEQKISLQSGNKNKVTMDINDDGFFVYPESRNDMYFRLLPNLENIQLMSGKSGILLGKTTLTSGGIMDQIDGIVLGEFNSGSIAIAKGKGIAIGTNQKGPIILKYNDDFNIELDPDPQRDRIRLKKDEFSISLGNVLFGTKNRKGIFLINNLIGSIGISEDYGIGIKVVGKNKMLMTGENDLKISFKGNIEISGDGDINIKSQNGNVNLFGKKINLNE